MADQNVRNQNAAGNGYYLNIEGYYDQIHRTTWARRVAGVLAGTTLGALYGAAIGVLATFVPYVLHALGVPGAENVNVSALTPSAVGSSAALFSAVTAGIGMTFAADVAVTSASSAVGMEEKEKREKLQELRTGIPEKVCKDCAEESAIARKELKQDEDGSKGPPLFSWKVAAVTVPLFAAFGALIGLNAYTAAAVFNSAFTDLASGVSAASVAGSAVVFGMFGTIVGIKNSLLTNKLTNFYYDVVTERLFNKGPQQDAVALPHQAISTTRESAPERIVSEPVREGKPFAAKHTSFSLQALLDKTEDHTQDTRRIR